MYSKKNHNNKIQGWNMKGRQGRLKLKFWKKSTIPLGSFVVVPRYHSGYPKRVKALRLCYICSSWLSLGCELHMWDIFSNKVASKTSCETQTIILSTHQ